MDEDKEYIKEVKEKDNKEEAKKDKGKFPLRTFKPNEELTQHMREFILEYDFIVLLSLISILTFATSQLWKIFVPQQSSTNFIFYILVVLVIMVTYYTIKLNMFPFEFNDENKILMVFSLKAFIVSYMIIGYFTEYFDFNLGIAMQQLQSRADILLKPTGVRYVFNIETFQIAIAFMSAVLSITVVHLAIKFAYHFFFLNKTSEMDLQDSDASVERKVSNLKILLAINLVCPVIVIFMYIPALSRNMVVPNVMSNTQFDLARVMAHLLILMMKTLIFYDELQFNFNDSYFLIKALLANKSEKLFDYIQLKIKLKFVNTWSTCFTYVAMILIPALFLIIYMHRYFAGILSPSTPKYDFTEFMKTLPTNDFTDATVVRITDGNYLMEVLKQIIIHGLIPEELEKVVFSYLLFSFYVSWFFVSTFGLLYYRKFKSQ